MTPITSEVCDSKYRYCCHGCRCEITVPRNKKVPPLDRGVVRRSTVLAVRKQVPQFREPNNEPIPISAQQRLPRPDLLIVSSGGEFLNGTVLYQSIRLRESGKYADCSSTPAASKSPNRQAQKTRAGARQVTEVVSKRPQHLDCVAMRTRLRRTNARVKILGYIYFSGDSDILDQLQWIGIYTCYSSAPELFTGALSSTAARARAFNGHPCIWI